MNLNFRIFFLRIFFIVFWVISASCISIADSTEEEMKGLIHAYVTAVETDDLELVRAAWEDLNRNQDAVDYMLKHMPQLHYLFQVRGLYFQMANLEEERKKVLGGSPSAESSVESTLAQVQQDLSNPPGQAGPFSVSETETDRLPTNGEIVARAQNKVRLDNRQIALSNPNQNRLDNAVLIQGRADAFYEQKFQDAPRVLVPPASQEVEGVSAETGPDVRVRSLSAEIVLSQSSPKPALVTVSINGRVATRDLKLAGAAESLSIYLEPGINELSLELKDQTNAVHSVAVLFSSSDDGPKRFSWSMKSGDRQTVKIDAQP